MRGLLIGSGANEDPSKIARARELRRNLTPEEKLLWEQLRGNKLRGLHFRRQQVFAGFILDFYCHAARLVVEVDGAVHLGQVEYDAERTLVLEGHELRVLRFTNREVRMTMPEVLKRISVAAYASDSP